MDAPYHTISEALQNLGIPFRTAGRSLARGGRPAIHRLKLNMAPAWRNVSLAYSSESASVWSQKPGEVETCTTFSLPDETRLLVDHLDAMASRWGQYACEARLERLHVRSAMALLQVRANGNVVPLEIARSLVSRHTPDWWSGREWGQVCLSRSWVRQCGLLPSKEAA